MTSSNKEPSRDSRRVRLPRQPMRISVALRSREVCNIPWECVTSKRGINSISNCGSPITSWTRPSRSRCCEKVISFESWSLATLTANTSPAFTFASKVARTSNCSCDFGSMTGTRIRPKIGRGCSSSLAVWRSGAKRWTISGEVIEVNRIITIAALNNVWSNNPVSKPITRVGMVTAACACERP